jgi:hypothetical protein
MPYTQLQTDLVLSGIVRDDPTRATGRRLDPETAHVVVSWESFELDS